MPGELDPQTAAIVAALRGDASTRQAQEQDKWRELQMMTPEQRNNALAPQLAANNLPNRGAFLQRQLEMASALRNEPARRYESVPGAILGGVGHGIDKFMNGYERKQLTDAVMANMKDMQDPSKLYTDDYIRFRANGADGGTGQVVPMGFGTGSA